MTRCGHALAQPNGGYLSERFVAGGGRGRDRGHGRGRVRAYRRSRERVADAPSRRFAARLHARHRAGYPRTF